jgi:glutamate racemase
MSIAVFDSGVGGISVLKSLVEVMPNEDFIYYGDSANAPYGTKTLEQVRALTCEHAKELILNQHAKGLVVACNTATSGSAYIKRAISRCSYRRDRACSQACDAFYGKSESACDGYTYDYQGGKT